MSDRPGQTFNDMLGWYIKCMEAGGGLRTPTGSVKFAISKAEQFKYPYLWGYSEITLVRRPNGEWSYILRV